MMLTMKRSWTLLALPALALALLLPQPTHAAAFIKFDGVDGESVDEQHRGAIDVESFSWGVSNTAVVGGGGGGAGKASFQDIHFSKRLDKSSPVLALACASGTHIKSAKLFVRKSGGSDDYYVITLTDVLVSSISVGGGSGDTPPTESVSFNFTKIEWRYVPTDSDGSPGTPVESGWDIASNTSYP